MSRSKSKVVPTLNELLGGDGLLGDELEVEDSLIPNLKWPQVFHDEIQHGVLIPGGIKCPADRHGFETVLGYYEISRSVVGESSGNGGDADLPLVHIDGCSGLIRADRHPAAHTSRRGNGCDDHQYEQEATTPASVRSME